MNYNPNCGFCAGSGVTPKNPFSNGVPCPQCRPDESPLKLLPVGKFKITPDPPAPTPRTVPVKLSMESLATHYLVDELQHRGYHLWTAQAHNAMKDLLPLLKQAVVMRDKAADDNATTYEYLDAVDAALDAYKKLWEESR